MSMIVEWNCSFEVWDLRGVGLFMVVFGLGFVLLWNGVKKLLGFSVVMKWKIIWCSL